MSVSRQSISCYVGQTDTLKSYRNITHTHTLFSITCPGAITLAIFVWNCCETVHLKPVRQQTLCLSIAVCVSSEVAGAGAIQTQVCVCEI